MHPAILSPPRRLLAETLVQTLPLAPPRQGRESVVTVTPALSAVIVNYHTWEETVALVRQIQSSQTFQGGGAEVVIVDNHSPGSAAARRIPFRSQVALRRWGRNKGFARAANEGARLSRGEWLLLLNPDITLPDGFIDDALSRAEHLRAQDPTAGVVGFALRHTDGTRQHSCGPFPTLAGSLLRLLLPRSRRKYHAFAPDRPCPVPWITGCCFLVHRTCFQKVGGFTRDYFLYYEDVDFCRRAREQGWSVWFDPALQVTHHRPLHSRAVPAHLRLFTRHGLLTYARRHWPGWHFRAVAALVRIEARARAARAAWQGDADACTAFTVLNAIAQDLLAGRPRAARARLDDYVSRREAPLGSDPVRRHPQPQPAGPAEYLPG